MLEGNILLITLALSGVSFLAGVIDSIAGGGGLLLIPALLFAGFPPQTVLGTNKFAASIGTSVALYNFVKNKKVIWHIVKYGLLFSLLGSFLGSKTILFFAEETVGKIIVILLPLAMGVTLIPRKSKRVRSESTAHNIAEVGAESADGVEIKLANEQELEPRIKIIVPLICLTIGFYDGFFGPGTGSFLILAFYFLVGLDLVEASATAKVFNLASCLSALLVFLIGRKVLFFIGIPLALANVAGNYLGSSLAIKKGTAVIKGFLIISLAILFISLLWKYYLG